MLTIVVSGAVLLLLARLQFPDAVSPAAVVLTPTSRNLYRK